MAERGDTIEPIARDLEAVVRRLGRISAQESDFTRDSHLFFDSYLDSLGVVALIGYIEKTYGIKLGGDTLADERFGSVSGISAIVAEQAEGRQTGWM
jgi:acyl carrier protein